MNRAKELIKWLEDCRDVEALTNTEASREWQEMVDHAKALNDERRKFGFAIEDTVRVLSCVEERFAANIALGFGQTEEWTKEMLIQSLERVVEDFDE